jgi:CRP-like cAMP-binding protein
MYFLTKGQVEVFRGIQNQPLGVLREGSFFGEVAILRDVPRIASVRALTDGEVYVLRRTGVLELSQSHPAFGQHLGQAAKGYTTAMA